MIVCQEAGRSIEIEGETGRKGFTRGIQHLKAIRLEDGENSRWKHCQVDHNVMRAKVHKTTLVRQVNEAVRIIISKAEYIMNSKLYGTEHR